MKYKVNKDTLHYETAGNKVHGDDEVLIRKAIDLTAKTSWRNSGYTVDTLFDSDLYKIFSAATNELLIELWQRSGLLVDKNFQLDQYHMLAIDQEKHLSAIEQTKLVDGKFFPVSISLLEKRVSDIIHEAVIVKNPYDKQSVFHFRVIRPGQQDNNPLHRDVWLEDYKDCINLYIPVAGSNERSSLVIIPESHQWPESKIERTISGAEINGVKYNVPAVTHIAGEHAYVRPNPALNEVLVFSPYLIHGGSANLNVNSTRISIEIRLWKK